MSVSLTRGPSRLWAPRQQLAELLLKRWFDSVVPAALLVIVVSVLAVLIPGYLSGENFRNVSRQFGEFGFVCLAMALSLIGGAIDLSVGSIFALANFGVLYLLYVRGWPLETVAPVVILGAAALGSINGMLVGALRARAFLTTLATMIIFRAVYNLFIVRYGGEIAGGSTESSAWDFLGAGDVLGVPPDVVALVIVAVAFHFLLSRSRFGWHITAVGAGRLAARHAGLPVRRTIFQNYIVSACLAAVGGIFYAAQFSNASADAGAGTEILALSGVVLGGVSLYGGRGTIGKAFLGAITVYLLSNGLVSIGASGGMNWLVSGLILLFAVGIDVKFRKNLSRFVAKIYTDPAAVVLPARETPSHEVDTRPGANFDLRGAYGIGFQGRDYVGQEDFILDDREMRLAGPEDVAIDAEGRVFVGTNGGLVIRFSGANLSHREVYASIGGQVRGLAFDAANNLFCCVAGMGLYVVRPDRTVSRLADETGRTLLRLRDDSRLLTPCDLTILPDSRIVFSENSYRYDIGNWLTEAMELRPNGRLLVYDPATLRTKTLLNRLVFPSGVCLAHDGKSILFAEMWLCRISRLWISGPRAGTVERLVEGLSGYPANINPSSSGGYWVAIIAARTPAFDLAAQMPGFRRGIVRRLPNDETPVPNFNCGGAMHVDANAQPTRVLWDPPGRGQTYPAVTSARESGPYLYLTGVFNNRIGRIVLDRAGASWISPNIEPVEPAAHLRAAE
jgi:ribose transport system permease protein